MAVNRQIQRRRKFNNKRRNMKKKAPSNKTLNKKIKHIENNIMELKFNDTFAASQNLTPAGGIFYLTDIAQGDTASDRTGNEIFPTSVQVRIQFFSAEASVVTTSMRVILFWDRQPNGANPVVVGASTTQSLLDTGVITDVMLAPRNFNTIERYKILQDHTYTINAQEKNIANTAYIVQSKYINLVQKLNRQVKYNNTSAAITAAVSNALHLVFYTDPTNANPGSVSIAARIYYRDS